MGKRKGILDHSLVLEIKDDEDLNSKRKLYSKNQKIKFNCKVCGKSVEVKFFQKQSCLCFNCQRKQTSIKRFGVDNYAKTSEKLQKEQETNLKLYGAKHYNQSSSFKEKLEKINEKRKETNLRIYKVENPNKLESVKKKIKQTKKEKHGDENYNNSEKRIQTCYEIYGFKSSSQNEKVKEKAKSHNLEKWGFVSTAQNPIVKEKSKQTCCKKYGVDNYMKTKEAREYFSKKGGFHHFCHYSFGSENFDSSWELALWIYAKDHNEEIEREPCFFEYEFDGVTHRYFPDFKYKGKLIEIKGDHLFQKMMIENTKNFAKFLLMKSLGVNILRKKEIQLYLNYVKNTYGKDYLKSFRQR